MLFDEIKSFIENKISPRAYNFKSKIHGIHYGQESKNKLIKKVLITNDLTLESIYFALKKKANLIISLHGLVNEPIVNFSPELINKLTLLSRYPMEIFVLNDSFIAAEGGISDTIMNVLHLKLDKPFFIKDYNSELVPIGRVCYPNPSLNQEKSITMEDLIIRIRSNLEINDVYYVGDLKRLVKKICIIGMDNLLTEILKVLKSINCDCLITGQISNTFTKIAKETGISLIKMSLFNVKMFALRKLYNLLSLKYPNDEFFFFKVEDPLKLYDDIC